MTFKDLFEVLYISNLTWLGDSNSVLESLFPVVVNSFFSSAEHSHKEKIACDSSTSSTLSGVSVDDCHVVGVLVQKLIHVIAAFKEHVDGWRVVVLPVIVQHVPFELLGVVRSVAQVNHLITTRVLLLKKLCHAADAVPVHGLHSAGWEAHCHDVVSDVGNVEIEVFISVPVSLTAHL